MSAPFDTLTQLVLEIPPAVQQQAWQHQSFSTSEACWNAYLNQVCLSTFLPWLQAEYEPNAQVYPSSRALPSQWHVVNGTAITLGSKRLVLIPEKTIDASEFRVPQEWVDIPSWAGDYYLAVQVDPDDQLVQIWGYTTHEQIKLMGSYDADDRAYCLDAHHLVQDLSVLWVVRQLYPDEPTQTAIAPLAAVAPAQAENLLQRLSNPTVTRPRLEIPFQLWGALLEQDEWRQRLYQQRQGESAPVRAAIHLSQWLQNAVTEGWQVVENLLGADAATAFSFRQATDLSEPAVKRAKELVLPNQRLLLLVAVEPEADGRVGIRIQLRPSAPDQLLPETLSLSLRSSTGDPIQSVQARSQDNVIQLKRFKIVPGTPFSLQITIADTHVTEYFIA